LPTVVVQAGGCSLNNLRKGAPAFFQGLDEAAVTVHGKDEPTG